MVFSQTEKLSQRKTGKGEKGDATVEKFKVWEEEEGLIKKEAW